MTVQTREPIMKTKIIATLGPACTSRELLAEMFDAGMDVCRLNFSHGDADLRRRLLGWVRELAAERRMPTCVIGDLCGPKIRLGVFPDGPVTLAAGTVVRIIRGEGPCSAERLTVSYAALVDEVAVGQRLLIDDGRVRLVVRERRGDELVCECVVGGTIDSRKGVNLPDTALSVPALTEKDLRDLDWALEHGLDYVALSFVRQPEDLYELRRAIKARGRDIPVIIKIEKTEALWHLDELIANADGVLVARGDLGVEADLWQVPVIQKDIVAECRQAGVPVIVATQMLQSMIEEPTPTRAEVSDVANAILDQADAVMLSGETAVGRYPVAAIEMMNRIAGATEEYLAKRPPCGEAPGLAAKYRPTAAVAHAAVAAARDLGARLVAVWTATGTTVRLVAQHRLPMPVLGLTYNDQVYRRLNLLYGVVPVRVEPMDNPAAMAAALDAHVLERGLAARGDLIIVVTSTRPTTPGATDTALVRRVGDAA
ncbi:MAG: pyruvate kinase [Planctomycetota bacterium]